MSLADKIGALVGRGMSVSPGDQLLAWNIAWAEAMEEVRVLETRVQPDNDWCDQLAVQLQLCMDWQESRDVIRAALKGGAK